MAPKDRQELQEMLQFSLRLDVPVSIRYPKGEAYSLGETEKVKLAKAQILKKGEDLCLIAIGSMVKTAFEYVSLLKEEGIKATLINARFIKPLDRDLLLEVAKEFDVVVTLEEGNSSCGFGSAILEFYETEGVLDKLQLIRAALPDEFISAAKREKLLEIYGLDARSLRERLKNVLERKAIGNKHSRL
jgi:1-deoxy-D-xylulose-5-phosphate synthase